MPDKIHPFKVVLTQHLVHRYCNGVGQIEGAGVGNHGDTHRLVVVVMHKLFGQAPAFPSEDKISIVAVGYLTMTLLRFCGKIEVVSVGMRLLQLGKTVPIVNFTVLPVVQPCTLQHFVACVKPEGTHKMHHASRGSGCAHNISGVLRDFRFHQYYVNHR